MLGDLLKTGLRTVIGAATGGLSEGIFSLVEGVFGNDISPEQKALLKQKAIEYERERELAIMKAADDAEKNVTKRAALLEGTAKDLSAMGWFGRPIVFLRGCQRPAWGFFTMFLDYKWLTGGLQVASENIVVADEQMGVMLIVINVLVLGFLFGERTVKNLTPLITQVFGKTQPQK